MIHSEYHTIPFLDTRVIGDLVLASLQLLGAGLVFWEG